MQQTTYQSSMDIEALSKLTKDIQLKLDGLGNNHSHEQLRQDLVRSARSLVSQLETPREKVARMIYFDANLYPVTRVLVDLKVFEILANSSRPISAVHLAKECKSDVRLLERLLKHVSVAQYVHETGPDEYTANEVTRCLASPGGQGVVIDIWNAVKPYEYLPQYLKEIGYASPDNKDDSAWHRIHGKHFFDYIFAPGNERLATAFHNHMKFKNLGQKWFDVPEIMEAAFGADPNLSPDKALILDVGGSAGHDLIEFAIAHPKLPGRKILQDVPSTIESVDKDLLSSHGIEAMAHDIFIPQPILHSKVYFLKMVLHDWPTEQCRQILSNIASAMKPGYSKILLNEIVIPETDARWFETSLDILMMTVHAARERKEREWRELIEGVNGLRVKRFWVVEGAVEQVIEIERA